MVFPKTDFEERSIPGRSLDKVTEELLLLEIQVSPAIEKLTSQQLSALMMAVYAFLDSANKQLEIQLTKGEMVEATAKLMRDSNSRIAEFQFAIVSREELQKLLSSPEYNGKDKDAKDAKLREYAQKIEAANMHNLAVNRQIMLEISNATSVQKRNDAQISTQQVEANLQLTTLQFVSDTIQTAKAISQYIVKI